MENTKNVCSEGGRTDVLFSANIFYSVKAKMRIGNSLPQCLQLQGHIGRKQYWQSMSVKFKQFLNRKFNFSWKVRAYLGGHCSAPNPSCSALTSSSVCLPEPSCISLPGDLLDLSGYWCFSLLVLGLGYNAVYLNFFLAFSETNAHMLQGFTATKIC